MKHASAIIVPLFFLLPVISPAQQAFSGIFEETGATQISLYDIPWETLRSKNKELAVQQFGLIDLEAVSFQGEISFWGIWREGQGGRRLERAAGWENFLKLRQHMAEEGYLLEDVEGYRDKDKRLVFLGIWTKTQGEEKIWRFQSWEGFEKQTAAMGRKYFQLRDIEAFTDERGAPNFLAVYHKQPPSEQAYPILADNPEQFYQEKYQRNKSGYSLIDYETFDQNGITYLVGLFRKSEVKENCRHRLDWTSFATYHEFLGKSYQLADLEVTEGAGIIMAPPANTNRLDQTPNIGHQIITASLKSADAQAAAQSAPCAAANALAWLSQRGFPRLDPARGGDAVKGYPALTRMIANNHYMKSIRPGGATVYSILDGLVQYVEDQGYDIEQVTLQDVRHFDRQQLQSTTARRHIVVEDSLPKVSQEFAKEGLVGNSIVLIQWGIYEPIPDDSLQLTFRKTSNHWATVVGYGVNEYGNENPEVLIVHSPSRGGEAPVYLRVQELDSRLPLKPASQLIDPQAAAASAIPAGGQQYLQNAMHAEGKKFAVWERTAVVKLQRPSVAQRY